MNFLLVGLGGFLGAVSRYGVSLFLLSFGSSQFPFATFFVNTLGSITLGMIFFKTINFNDPFYLFLAVGFLGAFTTFSTFSLENMQMIENGRVAEAVTYTALSVICCVGGVYISKFF